MLALATAPAPACANPLLSGYGGPGQGDQAILGAALVNGPSSGGGSSSAGGGVPNAGAPVTLAQPQANVQGSGGATSASPRRGARSRPSRKQPRRASAPRARAYMPPSVGAGRPAADLGGGTLGLSGTDFVYMLLALGALGLTAVVTRQLAHGAHRDDERLKG